MKEYTTLIIFILLPIIFSILKGTYSYCDFLFGKYAKAEEYYKKLIDNDTTKENKEKKWKLNLSDKEREEAKKHKIQKECLISRPLKSKTETDYYYPNDRPRRKRFDFFMNLTKINLIITVLLLLCFIIFVLFDIFPYNILKNIILTKVIIVDGFCISCCIPFGFLSFCLSKRYDISNWKG